MPITRVRARLATTHPIAAYGGTELPREALEQVARAVAGGSVPMHFEHDISRPVPAAVVASGVEELEDGHFAAWVEFDVDAELWEAYGGQVAAAGAPGGMSISFTSPMAGRSLAGDAPLVVAADRHHFADDEIDEAVTLLSRLGVETRGELLYQFSFEPVAKILVEVVWPTVMALGPDVVASAIYDAMRSFFRPGRGAITFNVVFRETPRGKRTLKIHIEATSEAEFASAVNGLPHILRAGGAGTFASTGGKPLGQVAPTPGTSGGDAPE